jgi:hypothetical protein
MVVKNTTQIFFYLGFPQKKLTKKSPKNPKLFFLDLLYHVFRGFSARGVSKTPSFPTKIWIWPWSPFGL